MKRKKIRRLHQSDITNTYMTKADKIMLSVDKHLSIKERAKILVQYLKLNPYGQHKHTIDRKVLGYLIKHDLVKIDKVRRGKAVYDIVKILDKNVAMENINKPYANRIADLEESGLPYRGKNRGKVKPKTQNLNDVERFYVNLENPVQLPSGNILPTGVYEFKELSKYYYFEPFASQIIAIAENQKPLYLKQRATNPKTWEVPKDILLWFKLKAKRLYYNARD